MLMVIKCAKYNKFKIEVWWQAKFFNVDIIIYIEIVLKYLCIEV